MLKRFENFQSDVDPYGEEDFEGADILWVPVVDDDEDDPNFIPTRYRPMGYPRKDIEFIYKNYWDKYSEEEVGPHLPYFETQENCQKWCDKNPYKK
jgi:hypothetical protein